MAHNQASASAPFSGRKRPLDDQGREQDASTIAEGGCSKGRAGGGSPASGGRRQQPAAADGGQAASASVQQSAAGPRGQQQQQQQAEDQCPAVAERREQQGAAPPAEEQPAPPPPPPKLKPRRPFAPRTFYRQSTGGGGGGSAGGSGSGSRAPTPRELYLETQVHRLLQAARAREASWREAEARHGPGAAPPPEVFETFPTQQPAFERADSLGLDVFSGEAALERCGVLRWRRA